MVLECASHLWLNYVWISHTEHIQNNGISLTVFKQIFTFKIIADHACNKQKLTIWINCDMPLCASGNRITGHLYCLFIFRMKLGPELYKRRPR